MLKVLLNRLYLSFIGVVAIFLVTVLYLVTSVLDVPVSGTTTIMVDMPATGGLFEGSAVTYRGVKVGKVRKIELHDVGVQATAVLATTEKIPADLTAKVRSLSPVGEQYLDLQPRTASGPYLTEGSTIPAEVIDLPRSLSSTVIAVSGLLDQIDDSKLNTILTELATGLAGTGQDIGKMVDQGEQLLAELDQLWPATDRLLTNADKVLDIVPESKGNLQTLAKQSRQFARFLKNYDPELQQTLKVLPGQIRSLHAMLVDAAAYLPGFLGAAVDFSGFFIPYEPHLRELLKIYGPGLGTLAQAVNNGALQISAFALKHDLCDYGTPVRSPLTTERIPMRTDANCEPGRSDFQRGAHHAPGPLK